MLRATATPKYSHMQNRPSHVKICTQARRRIVGGIAITSWTISDAAAPRPPRSAFIRLNAFMSAGGGSSVVAVVQRTAAGENTPPGEEAPGTAEGEERAAVPP